MIIGVNWRAMEGAWWSKDSIGGALGMTRFVVHAKIKATIFFRF